MGTGDLGDDVARARSWSEAIEHCSSEQWDEKRMDEANLIRLQLPQRRMNQWNSIVGEIKHISEDLVAAQIRRIKEPLNDQTELRNAVNWDILHACIESEYADDIDLRFYQDVADWYLAGHFPCGWTRMGRRGAHVVF